MEKDIEKIFIAYLLKDFKLFKTVKEKIQNKKLFFKNHLLKKIYESLEKYEEFFGVENADFNSLSLFILKNEQEEKSKEELKILLEVLKNIETKVNFSLVIDEMVEYSMYNALVYFFSNALSVEEKNIKKIYKDIFNFIKDYEIQEVDVKKGNLSDLLIDLIINFNKENTEKIYSGIKILDEKIGGFRKGELVVFTAITGAGKSILLMNLAKNFFEKGFNVVFISLEISLEETLLRIISSISNIKYSKIRNREISNDEKKEILKKILKFFIESDDQKISELDNIEEEKIFEFFQSIKKKKNFFLIYDILKDCTIKVIYDIIEDAKPDILVLDHINLLVPEKSSGVHWFDQGNFARELKILAKLKNILVVTAAQMNLIPSKGEVSIENIRYSKMIAENADYVLALYSTQEDKLMGKIRLKLTKHRFSETVEITLREIFSQMRIEEYFEDLEQNV